MKQQTGLFPTRYKAAFLLLVASLIGGKWYSYVALAETPFDDIGSSLNSMMPGPINRLGCDMLRQRFGNVPIPPKGCDSEGRWT